MCPAFLVAAMLLLGISSLPAATTARQALCTFSCKLPSPNSTAAFAQFGGRDAQRWSSAKLDVATQSFPPNVHIPGEFWLRVSNKSQYSRAVTVELTPLSKQALHMVLSPPGGADA